MADTSITGMADRFMLSHGAVGKHVRGGNCFGYGVKTDVCMKHEQPRGECDECPRCPKCDADALGVKEKR